jgi:hypothetical protein
MCPVAPDPASLIGRAPASQRHALQLLWAVGLKHKKNLVDLLGLRVPNAHTHVSKAADARAIMCLQDVCIVIAFNAYKTCRQAATVQRQLC